MPLSTAFRPRSKRPHPLFLDLLRLQKWTLRAADLAAPGDLPGGRSGVEKIENFDRTDWESFWETRHHDTIGGHLIFSSWRSRSSTESATTGIGCKEALLKHPNTNNIRYENVFCVLETTR